MRAIHFHYGPRFSGVGLFIEKVFTDEKLPWTTVHVSGDDLAGSGRYGRFVAALIHLARRDETVIFAHTLKAGIAGGFLKFWRPIRLIYVGHGVRYSQKRDRLGHRLKYALAENFVSLMADAVVHLRQRDIENARAILALDASHKTFLMTPKLAPC
jgi:hypothetical protein